MVTTPTTKRQARILELDYLKCVFILLMVVFHLVYIGNRYPVAKAFVYTFHMPGFLIAPCTEACSTVFAIYTVDFRTLFADGEWVCGHGIRLTHS